MNGGSPCTESSTTFTPGCSARSRSSVSSPPMRGIVMSRTTTSGAFFSTCSSTSRPSEASAHDVKSLFGLEQPAQPLPDDAVVVGDQNGGHVERRVGLRCLEGKRLIRSCDRLPLGRGALVGSVRAVLQARRGPGPGARASARSERCARRGRCGRTRSSLRALPFRRVRGGPARPGRPRGVGAPPLDAALPPPAGRRA